MKFNCGPTSFEKSQAREARLSDWHLYYCFLPKRMTNTHECRWLEWVLRKGRRPRHHWYWDYKPL